MATVDNLCVQRTEDIATIADDATRQMAEVFKQKECPTR